MEFLNLLKINNVYLIQLLFLINFVFTFLIFYPIGYLLTGNGKIKNLLFCSLISISFTSVIIAITLNFLAIAAKYLVIIFFILNLLIFILKKRFFNTFVEQIKLNKIFFLIITIIYFLIINTIYPLHLEANSINIPYGRHLIYYFSPIQEILNANYFSRIRLAGLYPMEWASFYFFQASFNAIFLNFFSNFGYLSLIFLKCFFFSLFFSSISIFLFKKFNLKKNNIIFHFMLILNVFFYLFLNSNISWFIFGNGTIIAFALLFLFQNLFKEIRSINIFSCILLVLVSFKNILFTTLIYYYLSVKNYKHLLFLKLKLLGINKQHLILIILLLSYLLVTFFSSQNVFGKFHVLGSYGMWESTFTFNIINNYIILILLLSFIILSHFLKSKKEESFFKISKFDKIYLFFLIICIPFFSLLIIFFKILYLDLIINPDLIIFLKSFTFENLKFYFLAPIVWFFLLSLTNKEFKKKFLSLIVLHVGLSIFIHNHIILPAFYAIEVFFVLWLIFNFLKNEKFFLNKIKILLLLFLINGTYIESNKIDPVSRIQINLDDLKKFSNLPYICPDDLRNFKNYKNIVESDLLSGLLNKRFYSNLAYNENYNYYENFHLATPMGIIPNFEYNNPCKNKL